MEQIELTEKEWQALAILFEDLKNGYAVEHKHPYAYNPQIDLVGNALDKILEALRPPYKPTIEEIKKLRELSNVGAWVARSALIKTRGDMNEALRIVKEF